MVEEAQTEGLGWDYFQEGKNYEAAHEGVRGSSAVTKALLVIAVVAGGAALCYYALNAMRAKDEEAKNCLRPESGALTVANVEDGSASKGAPATPKAAVPQKSHVIFDKNNSPEVRAPPFFSLPPHALCLAASRPYLLDVVHVSCVEGWGICPYG